MAKKINLDDGQVNGAADASEAYVGNGPNFTKSFPAKDVVDLQINDVRFDQAQRKSGQNGVLYLLIHLLFHADHSGSGFKTDTDISGGIARRERQLQPWDGGAEGIELSSGLETMTSSSGPWDQFATNDRITGLRSNYDESFYTTELDRSHPDFKKREAEAEKIAREIMGSSVMNSHVAEERGLKVPEDNGEDEEAKSVFLHT
jgi:PAB1-binding protein PBP1